MKKKFAIALALLLTLIFVGAAFANGPTEPVCPDGEIATKPAEWVPGEYSCPDGFELDGIKCKSFETVDKIVDEPARPYCPDGELIGESCRVVDVLRHWLYKPAIRAASLTEAAERGEYWCPDGYSPTDDFPDGNEACGLRVKTTYKLIDAMFEPATYMCPKGFTETAAGACKKVVRLLADFTPGYWIDPICVVDLCSNIRGIQETMPEGAEDPDGDKICTRIPGPTPTPEPLIVPSVSFQQGCVDGVPVIGIDFSGEPGDTLSITGNGRDLSYSPGVRREEMRPFDSYGWTISRSGRTVDKGGLLVEACPEDTPVPTAVPSDDPDPDPEPSPPKGLGGGGGDAMEIVVAGLGLLSLLSVGAGVRAWVRRRDA